MAFDEELATRLRVATMRIARELAKQTPLDGLTRTQLDVLGFVARAEQIGLGELAEAEGINPTMLSRIVGKLEALNLLRRIADPADRRAAFVQITPKGARTHEKGRRARIAYLAERLAALSDADADALLRALPALEQIAGLVPAVAAG